MHATENESPIQATTGSKLAYVMRSTVDYFKLGMHVEITTNLAKLSMKNKRKRPNLKLAKNRRKGKEGKPLGYNSFGVAFTVI